MAQASDNKVSLGCGTLILIAVIVMIFSRGSDTRRVTDEVASVRRDVRLLQSSITNAARSAEDAEKEVKQLKESVASLGRTVDSLRQAVNTQTESINQLKAELHKAAAPAVKPDPAPAPPVER